MIKVIKLLILCFAFVMGGCAHDPALTKDDNKIDLSTNSVALLSIKVSNQNNPKYQLGVDGLWICPWPEKCRTRPYMHKTPAPFKIEDDLFTEYLLSFKLEGGAYNINLLMTSTLSIFPFNAATIVPLNLKAEIKPNSVVYLGHIDLILRQKKKDDEIRAGMFPLIDAAVVGFTTGTFDVEVKDKFDEDIKLFNTEYSVLQNIKIEKSILPQWIRPESNL